MKIYIVKDHPYWPFFMQYFEITYWHTDILQEESYALPNGLVPKKVQSNDLGKFTLELIDSGTMVLIPENSVLMKKIFMSNFYIFLDISQNGLTSENNYLCAKLNIDILDLCANHYDVFYRVYKFFSKGLDINTTFEQIKNTILANAEIKLNQASQNILTCYGTMLDLANLILSPNGSSSSICKQISDVKPPDSSFIYKRTHTLY